MKKIVSIDLKVLDLQSQTDEFSRKVKVETLIRSLFISFKPQIKWHPKKEYLRCKLIRGHKRANRKIKKGKLLYNNQKEMSEAAKFNWQNLSKAYLKFQSVLDSVSRTLFEPIKFKANKTKITTESSKSFNVDFCKRYFTEPGVRESYYYFIEYLFSDLNPDYLSKYLGFTCCQTNFHTLECAYKWLLMKRYANEIIIEDLQFEPWFPQEAVLLSPINNFIGNLE
ncbi:hypothetical protein SteCoe_13591 [Stentor coeruleus]|uniref:Uncharacterized protein n=1 Tax=Stentor coeruleus TaxID=5963 RepID=A0A1R2C7Z6_9CILI|nr:hypothetical protein SteCoe_13591 [Stentor coeruleus]